MIDSLWLERFLHETQMAFFFSPLCIDLLGDAGAYVCLYIGKASLED